MTIKFPFLTLFALALSAGMVKASDTAWGVITSGTTGIMVAINPASPQLVSISYGGTPYTQFVLLDSGTKNADPPLVIAQRSNNTLYGLDSSGYVYTIVAGGGALVQGNGGNIGFLATKGSSIGVTGAIGAVFISSDTLEISTGHSLYQYNFTTQSLSGPTSLSNKSVSASVSGLASGGSSTLFGLQYLPTNTAGIVAISSGTTANTYPGSLPGTGLTQSACLYQGVSLLYISDGNGRFFSYDTIHGILTTIINSYGNGIHSLTLSAGAGGASPTPTPTPTPSPTATPTPSPTPIVYSIPTGSLNVTAPETTPSGSPQCAPSWTYTASESSIFGSNPTIDPNGQIGIYRYYQTTTDGTNYLPTTATAAVPASMVWPWISGSTNTHGPVTYSAGQVGSAATPNNFYYGREILQLVYTSPGNGNNTLLDSKMIYQYPWNYNSSAIGPSPTAIFTNALTQTQAVSNPSPYASPSPTPSSFFDAPRFSVQMNNLYPAGTTSVIIYPGTPVNGSPSGATPIKNTTATTPGLSALQASGGLWTSAPSITFDIPQSIIISTTSPQTYTIAAIQTLPASAYALSATAPINPAVLNTLTFTIAGFNVNGTVGTVK